MEVCKIVTKKELIEEDYEVCGDYCCQKMKEHLKIRGYDYGACYNITTKRFRILAKIITSDYSDNYKYDDMNYCPFCGEKLQDPIVEKPTSRLTKKLKKLLREES
jgi:hypothetical protein